MVLMGSGKGSHHPASAMLEHTADDYADQPHAGRYDRDASRPLYR
jgi:hypothetical protein